ncbi:MAG: coenzyme F420-0:L-glutamate ligase [Elusimicrobiota bacterium]|jgi:F420-0:gamma-glutamyl ligase|nr:coenzyme F420-0:L-glutamate ligase [Elusimicrobiota bacterium]
MKIRAIKTGIFKEKQNLPDFIFKYLPKVKNGSVIAVSSKIAALWEGRSAPLNQKEKLIKKESDFALKTSLCWFTVKNGMVMTNAGIDESNVKNKIVLLPKNCYKTAAKLRAALIKKYKIKKLGIILTDSMILPLRAGVIAGAVGYGGFKGVKDLRNKKDLTGRKLKMTLIDIADTLASCAALMMGEADEQSPIALIEDAPVEFTDKTHPQEIKYPFKNDLYYPFFKAAGFKIKN